MGESVDATVADVGRRGKVLSSAFGNFGVEVTQRVSDGINILDPCRVVVPQSGHRYNAVGVGSGEFDEALVNVVSGLERICNHDFDDNIEVVEVQCVNDIANGIGRGGGVVSVFGRAFEVFDVKLLAHRNDVIIIRGHDVAVNEGAFKYRCCGVVEQWVTAKRDDVFMGDAFGTAASECDCQYFFGV